MSKSMAAGILWAFILIFPAAALVALVYRFPVPFRGYVGGPEAMAPAVVAVVFYGFIGGFFVVLAIGVVAGAIAYRPESPREDKASVPLLHMLCFVGDIMAALVLAVLDKLIGPW